MKEVKKERLKYDIKYSIIYITLIKGVTNLIKYPNIRLGNEFGNLDLWIFMLMFFSIVCIVYNKITNIINLNINEGKEEVKFMLLRRRILKILVFGILTAIILKIL